MKHLDTVTLKLKYQEFTNNRKTLVLNTIDENGNPFVSHAPYVKKDGKMYIYISQVSDHYRNVEKNEQIDVLLIADESSTPNLFARERARFACTTSNLGNQGHEDIFNLFNEVFGQKMMEMLRGMDFSLFELKPLEGRYVVGFGQAFDVDLMGDKFDHVVGDKFDHAVVGNKN
ncbi:heme iron utilization protein [Bacillus sp. 7884-1]|nr:heme iron utilization protein [Bacillus sp. 7884-1]